MTELDVARCLEGIRDTYFTCGDIQDDTCDEPTDPELVESMSAVETKLLRLLERDDALDEEEATRLAAICAVLNPPKPKVQIGTNHSKHAFPCSDTFKKLPAHPSLWPQAPLMIRPTPNTSTTIRGIRRSGASEGEYENFSGFCAGCILPINSGSEAPGNSLVIDFESPHFIGTLLMRIKQAPCNTKNTKYGDSSYFDGKKRKFQAIVKGRFKTPLPMSECITGQSFERPAGKLPARWVVTSFIKFVSTLAPQLEATIDGDKPRFLSPLVATAHTVLSNPSTGGTIFSLERDVEEPASTSTSSVLDEVAASCSVPDTTKSSVSARMKARKKLFNNIVAKNQKEHKFNVSKEYTFEFYQHLLDFGDQLAVNMGRPIGKVGLAQATDGQPLKFMSAHKDPVTGDLDSLWSFDIWHESLYPYAEMAVAKN